MIQYSKDFFINIPKKDIPYYDRKKSYYEQSAEAILFFSQEWEKITKGITIGGVFIHPWLYFHCNFFKTPIPINGVEEIINPFLRDNEWYMAETYRRAEKEGKGIFLYGSRRFSKSVQEASILLWNAITRPNTTEEIICGSLVDLTNISRFLEVGVTNMHPAFLLPTNKKDWGKHIQFGFKEGGAENVLAHSDIFVKNADAGKEKSSEKGAGGAPASVILDEALEENTILYAKDKEIPIKDIQIGDEIYDDLGNLTKVLYKVKFENVQLYKITFSDGREIEACENHLWEIIDKNNNKRVLTTKELKEKITKTNPFSIKNNKPIQYPERCLKITPYAIGYLIGDGGLLSGINFSYAQEDEQEILSYFKNDIDNFNLEVVKTQNTRSYFKNHKEFSKEIIRLNLNKRSWEKEIPKEYLIGSENQRMELLKGLLDSDGCCSINKSGNGKSKSSTTFTTTSEKLSKQFRRLCWSLGINTSLHSRQRYRKDNLNRVSYEIILQTDMNLFKLKRKSNKVIKRIGKQENKKIVDIQPSKIGNAYCIKVDNESKLFLAGDYIVTHNCGKFAFLNILLSLKDALETPDGVKAVVLLSGTSGSEKLSRDALKVLSNPAAYNILPMDWDTFESRIDPDKITWKRSIFGMYIPSQMAYAKGNKKIESNLKDYLKSDNKELEKIDIQITDWKLANDLFFARRKAAENDKTALEKERMYRPLDPEDCFLSGNSNPFPTTEAKIHLQKLRETGNLGKDVELYRKEEGGIGYKLSDKKRAKFPFEGGIHQAPVVLYGELPETKPEYGEFTSGLDDYKQGESTGDSVGTFYVLERKTSVDMPTHLIKMSLATRPKITEIFYRQAEMGIEAFNSECFVENADIGFIKYLNDKHKADQLLAEGIEWSKSQNANSKATKRWGWHPTVKNKEIIFAKAVSYCWEEIIVGQDENGDNIVKLGVEFIPDPDLLQEIIDWKPGMNADRLVAWGSALEWAGYLTKLNIVPRKEMRNIVQQRDQINKAKTVSRGFIPLKKIRK